MRRARLILVVPALLASACPAPKPIVVDELKADPPLVEPAAGAAKSNPELDRGVEFVRAGKMKEAESHLKAAIAADPKSAPAHFYLGVVSDQGGDKKTAEELYRRALDLDPTLSEAGSNLGALLLLEPAKPEEAVKVLEGALAKAPAMPELQAQLLTNLGYAHFLMKKNDQAAGYYERALKNQESAETRLQLGIVLFEVGKAEAAVPHLLKAAEAARDDAPTLATIARMLGPGKAFADCVKLLDRVVELKKADAEIFVRRGVCKHSLKQEKEASADFNEAIKLDPKSQSAYFYLASSELELKNKPAAKVHFKKAIDLGKDTPIGKKAKAKLDSIR
jgi:Tfp pilus assembly protein PilF